VVLFIDERIALASWGYFGQNAYRQMPLLFPTDNNITGFGTPRRTNLKPLQSLESLSAAFADIFGRFWQHYGFVNSSKTDTLHNWCCG